MSPDPVPNADRSEPPEPKTSHGPSPLWLIILFAILFYWGQVYIDTHAGGFSPLVQAPYASVQQLKDIAPKPTGAPDLDNGKRVFEMVCAVCHQSTGLGAAALQVPPLAGSEWVITPGVGRLVRIPLSGLSGPITVKGQPWNYQMPAMGAALSDKDLADVLSYIRQAWDNKAGPVTPAQVKAIREQIASHPEPFTAEELQKIPETE